MPEKSWMLILLIYLLAINLAAYIMYGIDKKKARKQKWRIPESTLLLTAFLGGSAGAYAGMKIFHHKTRHLKFKILVPFFLVLHICLIGWCFLNGFENTLMGLYQKLF